MNIYLDNSATSWPKPPSVVDAISNYLNNYGGSPGRSGHHFTLKAATEVFETRELLASLFNAPSSDRVIFTANATQAINTALFGLLKHGDHVIISHMEHNSVVRPLRHLEQNGTIELTIVDCDEEGFINIETLKNSFKSNTKLVVTMHGSNVTGTIQPISQIGEICKSKKVLYMVDAAQSAGILPIDMQKENIDILAFTGHKELYGPSGIGGLCIKDDLQIESLLFGGTGSKSESETHPLFYPDRLEAGTLNTAGIVGLKAGIQYILDHGMNNILEKQVKLTESFLSGIRDLDGVIIYGPKENKERLPIVSLNIKDKMPSDVAYALDKEYGIMTRAGLHCSPLAHKNIGTFPHGTVRFSMGSFTTQEEIDYTIDKIKQLL
ncbi:MAG: aminotransferase class V-fold PLP-dependent enzyme [Bacteroidales bacterium]|nr:aminotransferase class V-fold PLP-dependent enzyme [Bacteroidales bacterium]